MTFQVPIAAFRRSLKPQVRNQRVTAWMSKLGIALVLGTWNLEAPAAAPGLSPIISTAAGGELSYHPDERGDRIPDFSSCGYAGGERAVPEVPVRIVVSPKAGDSTERIQRALNYVATLPPDTNGIRGAVLLLAGTFEVSGGLVISNTGVVLRGQGVREGGTKLVASGTDRRTLVRIVGRNNASVQSSPNWQVIDSYVAVGATRFKVRDAAGLKPGDSIRVVRPSTQDWIDTLAAGEFGGGIGGGWKPGSRDIEWDREIKAVEGNEISIDVPITTALATSKSQSPNDQPRVVLKRGDGGIRNVAVENLALESAFDSGNSKDENHSWCAITMEYAADCWVRQVTFRHFAGSAVAIYENCRRITIRDCASFEPVSEIGGYRRHTYFTMGQQTLFMRCFAERGRHDFAVGHCAAGPNAFVQCEAREALDDSGPIESWASGVLYDNVIIDGNALTLGFRPGNNAGIGWSAANCVLWNCSASVIRCWNPPGAQNWSFGAWAGFEGDGIWRSSNDFMKPDSLFAAQLADRLGSNAAMQLQLMPRPREESSNPPLDKAQELAAASHQPAAQLRDYILSAGTRDPILSDQTNARSVDEIFIAQSDVRDAPLHRLVITNGWLTMDGRLLVGGSAKVTWWRGSIRPDEAKQFGLGVTRFVPGRTGPGFTDDLNAVADAMIDNGDAALDHNYGLWYDRRRDDHERVRRMTGDVLPPFYEQPFARSGQGTAWDGLSRFDLTQFNPWYWSRLRSFAGICEERGLVLFHQNYFQHNILEAGAHWADFPWRSANNVNGTGFPEPPPYAGDKRIFQAELFYDVIHPVRRELHQNYIRHCLDNFTNSANVIQFTAAEFTGPLHFMQFWLDTIAQWKKAHSAAVPLVALSATKDVQDAILADAERRATVDVIDFRYWWRTDKGEFAPPGGKNLAPRQFERQWRGGRPSDLNLAGMAADYRAKFPAKPLICDFDSAGWAWLCAGGSLPRLPKTTDARLLAAIPQMKPWAAGSSNGRWALRDGDSQMLVWGGGELDLTASSGSFRVNVIDPRTGAISRGATVRAGGLVKIPAILVWLTKE